MIQLMLEDKRFPEKLPAHTKQVKHFQKELQAGNISIWDLAEFPSVSRPYKFTPFELKRLLDEYALCTTGINALARKHNIPEGSIYILLRRYPEISQYYERCLKQKAVIHNEKSVDLWEEPLKDDEFEETRYGKKLNYASVVFRDRKSQMYARQAALLDRDKFGEKQQIESTVKSFNVSRVISGDGAEANKTLMDLFTTFTQ